MVEFAVEDHLEAANGFFDGNVFAGRAGEDFGDRERLREEALNLARSETINLSSSDNSSMPRIAMMSCRSLYR